ncbi:MAG: hypothetical protein HN786_01420 [Cellvibrionales bacterium]|nr:hypothetical protein [Cellvibrionales bacterium]MCH9797911.1 hypothetical protein [Gammaproteobacteria bacterium]MDA7736730.1 hypothetical protein [Porticoccus sp.]MBT7437264.1 hypothetical protein [Cellvibrionales bacterium]MCH9843393.1 hypothetical protein [Gammaproteobacteria bacterium]
MKFYYILFISIGFSSCVTGNDQQVADMQDTKKLPSADGSLNSTKNQSILEMSNENVTTQKFNPSEEISEDLAIPFPVDI